MSNSQITHVIKKYIPEKLMNCVKLPSDYEEKELNAEEMVQAILSNSDNMLRMYGTAGELLLNLKTFQNFPLSHRCFGYDPKEPYSKIPIVYRNMDGEAFMNKVDVYCLLSRLSVENLIENPKSEELFCSMKAILLKCYEENITGVCEFCIYEEASWEPIQYIFSALQELSTKKSSFVSEEWKRNLKSYEEALGMFKSLLPMWKEHEYCGFEKDLKTFFASKCGNFHNVNLPIRTFAEFLKGFFSDSPTMNLPYDKEKNPNCVISVRVFESHGAQFVMKSELFNAINIRNPNSKRLECKEINGKLMTMSCEKVQNKYKDRIGNIEFIKCPIQRTDHKAVPIMTPSGGHCILATDCLFEILNEFIFTHQIFQKIDSENRMNVLRRFLLQIANFFSPHHKSIFFVTLKEQDKQKEEMIKFWKQFENIPAKYVRDVEKDGFSVQSLKDELEYLGLTELFPEIQEYAESVYSEVLNTKKGALLRTFDLFKAVEICLFNSIFKQFPTLHLFLHTQNACHLFPALNCDFCNSPAVNQFKSTNWTEIKKTISTCSKADPENTYFHEITLPDGTKLTNSYNQFFNKEQIRKHKIKYFIYDQHDLIYFEKKSKHLKPRRLRDECRYSLDAFQRFYPEKKLYIRTIPSMRLKREETKRVFAEEVLDLIPVVLRQQNTPINVNDDRLTKYRKKWETNNKILETTISLTEFWYILEEFDVDKTRITICPDPVYEITVQKMVRDMRMRSLNVIGPHGEQMMRTEQAVFHIFEVVVCCFNWTRDLCKEHENCLNKLKDKIILCMRAYTEANEGSYITVEYIESIITMLKSHCSFQLQSNTPSPLAELQQMEFDDMISKEEAISNCREFGITKFTQTANYSCMAPITTVIAVRDLYLSAWSEEFFDFETSDLRDLIADETQFKSILSEMPKIEELDTLKKKALADILKQTENLRIKEESEAEKDEKGPCIQKTSLEDIQKTSVLEEALEVKRPTSEDTQKSSESDKASDDIQAAKVLEKAPEVETPSPDDVQKSSVPQEASSMEKPSPDDIQKTSLTEKLPLVDTNQSKNCSKCLRTSEMCNEAKKELKMTQNKLEKYEKKAKRTDEVEKELKALRQEVKKKEKERNERELELEKEKKENEELKMKVSRLEANETRMRLNEKNHSILEKEQSEKIDELTAQFEHQKEIVELMELQIQQNEERLNSEIREKQRGFEELRAALNIMSNEKESIQREYRNLRERIASIPEAPPTPTVPESASEEPTHHRFALLGFQKIKDSLYNKKQLKQAKEMVEKLKSTSDLVEIHQIADYEYYQFEWNLLKYTKEVELNIQRIKETRDVSTVTPLLDSPEFSQRFMNLYWRIINNQSITPSELEVSDSECFICTEEMTSDQRTLQCEECKKVTHFECASKWLQIHRSCAHCRREMLDPNEFPNLGQ
ncbi:unnamed protein product [Caenorhabditis nigoni]